MLSFYSIDNLLFLIKKSKHNDEMKDKKNDEKNSSSNKRKF